jgi:hypothetical protein
LRVFTRARTIPQRRQTMVWRWFSSRGMGQLVVSIDSQRKSQNTLILDTDSPDRAGRWVNTTIPFDSADSVSW